MYSSIIFQDKNLLEFHESEIYVFSFTSTESWEEFDDKNQKLGVLIGDALHFGNDLR